VVVVFGVGSLDLSSFLVYEEYLSDLNSMHVGNVTATPVLSRSTYSPGDLMEGRIVVKSSSRSWEFYSLRLGIVGEIVHEDTHGSGEHLQVARVTLILAGRHENDTTSPVTTLPGGQHEFPFVAKLPLDALPSVHFGGADHSLRVHWYAEAMGEVRLGTTTPFQVMYPSVPRSISSRPSRAQQDLTARLYGCYCCFSYGAVTSHAELTRTVFALDRDTAVPWAVGITNDGEVSVTAVTAKLMMKCTAKCGNVRLNERLGLPRCVDEVKEDCSIASGRTATVTGQLPLRNVATPSLRSSVLDLSYTLRLELHVPYSDDPHLDIPINVYHTINDRDLSNPDGFEQRYNHVRAVPRQVDGFEQPNLYGRNLAVYQQGSRLRE